MNRRQPNHGRVKSRRSYTVEEVADLFGIHKNTVRNWIKNGLSVIDDKRPVLILGEILIEYLRNRRARNKQSCKPGELYCVRCRVPRPAAENIADFSLVNPRVGNLIALCPACGSIMNRRVSLARIDQICGVISVTITGDERHIS